MGKLLGPCSRWLHWQLQTWRKEVILVIIMDELANNLLELGRPYGLKRKRVETRVALRYLCSDQKSRAKAGRYAVISGQLANAARVIDAIVYAPDAQEQHELRIRVSAAIRASLEKRMHCFHCKKIDQKTNCLPEMQRW